MKNYREDIGSVPLLTFIISNSETTGIFSNKFMSSIYNNILFRSYLHSYALYFGIVGRNQNKRPYTGNSTQDHDRM